MKEVSAEADMFSSRKLELLKQLLEKKGINARRVEQIQRRKKASPCRLSYSQQRLWFLHQLQPDSPSYNMSSGFRLLGPLNVRALEKTLAEIVRRHESLRTTFDCVDGVPVQIISPEIWLKGALVDLSGLDESEGEAEGRRLAMAEALRPFDLAQGPLLRVCLVRLGEDDHAILLTTHHIISDGWSMDILVREVTLLYQAFAQEKPSPLEELRLQYADYAEWQRDWLQGKALEDQLAYWKRQLNGAPPFLELPTDFARTDEEIFAGGYLSVSLAVELSRRIKELSEREGVTTFMFLLGAFQTLLYRYSGQEEIVVGAGIANRNRPEIEGLIGFFVNTLVFRTNISGNPAFRTLLARVKEVALGAYDNQDLPFEKVVEEINPERFAGRNPLFQVGFGYQRPPEQNLELQDVSLTPLGLDRLTVNFDLSLEIVERERDFTLIFSYKAGLFHQETINRMAARLERLLESIVADPDARVSKLALMSDDELAQVLFDWNRTARDFHSSGCIHEIFEAQAARTPSAIALAMERDAITYGELDRRANRLAHYLRGLGVEPDARVGICLERGIDMLVGLLGILKAGGAYVPLDPGYPMERLAYMLEDAEVRVVLTESRQMDVLPSVWAQVICVDEERAEIDRESDEPVVSHARPENLAYIIYTSGSTGKPKGVMIPHRGVVNYLGWAVETYRVEEGSGAPVYSAIAFDMAVTSLFAPLLAGRKIVMVGDLPGAEPLIKALELDDGYSFVKLTPSHLEHLREDARGARVRRGARALILGGEALRGESVKQWRKNAPETRIYNEYGPTETVVGSCVYELPRGGEEKVTVEIGRPIANTQVYLLDEWMEPVPVGVKGEIYIGGEGVGRGYANRADLTAERFVPDPFRPEPGARLYRTGDAGRHLADGNIEFLGRIDHQVKVRGYRIELGEIESKLRQHGAVQEAVVVVREDAPGDQRLVAYIVAHTVAGGSQAPSFGELRNFLKGSLPDFMLPSASVIMDALPLTPSGKIDRRALPAPDGSRPDSEKTYVEPRTSIERTLAAIWQELLGIEKVGVYDNFFELGGHSLLLMQLGSRISKEFDVEVPLRILFDVPTIDEITLAIAELQVEREDSAEMARMIEELKQLSPEEVRLMIEEEEL